MPSLRHRRSRLPVEPLGEGEGIEDRHRRRHLHRMTEQRVSAVVHAPHLVQQRVGEAAVRRSAARER